MKLVVTCLAPALVSMTLVACGGQEVDAAESPTTTAKPGLMDQALGLGGTNKEELQTAVDGQLAELRTQLDELRARGASVQSDARGAYDEALANAVTHYDEIVARVEEWKAGTLDNGELLGQLKEASADLTEEVTGALKRYGK